MDPKINIELKISPVIPGEVPGAEMEVWDPPFERWMRMADELLGRAAVTLPKAVSRDPKTLKH
jgi:hypothetical protein